MSNSLIRRLYIDGHLVATLETSGSGNTRQSVLIIRNNKKRFEEKPPVELPGEWAPALAAWLRDVVVPVTGEHEQIEIRYGI